MHTTERPQYITQINAFNRFSEAYHLPLNARMLWFSLIDLFNKSDWAQWVYVDTLHLMAMIDAKSDKTAFLARQKLVDAGLLVYEKGKKSQPCRYRLVWFSRPCSGESSVESSVEYSVESSVENDGGSAGENAGDPPAETAETHTLYTRKEEDKEEKREEEPRVPAPLAQEWRAFADMRKKMRKPLTGSAAALLLRRLDTLAPGRIDEQKKILDQSVMNGWTGVFPLRREEAPEVPASYDVEEFERRLLYGKPEYKKRDV